jgi:hypothetical protein
MDHPETGVRSESSRPAPGEPASRQVASVELAVSLVRSLFCGLPRLEKRMAVFVSASDESDGGHHRSRFWHGGWVAPEKDWVTYFAPAWRERVLDAGLASVSSHDRYVRSRYDNPRKTSINQMARLAW